MTYQRFEQLPVWQVAADLAAKMFRWTADGAFRGKGDLGNQLQRAALSISNNIAEGFERGTTNELLSFLYYSRGSAGEVRSMLGVMNRMPEFINLKSEISNLKSECESISRQLRGWAASLQESDIKGPRHLTNESKQEYQNKTRRRAFEQKLADSMAEIKRTAAAKRRDKQVDNTQPG